MSEPIRYRPDWTYTGTAFVPFCRQQDNGEFVRYEDYTELKADNDRLKEAIADSYKAVDEMEQRFKALEAEFETHPMAIENARLKAEVERLTKAGDAMASHVRVYCSCFVCEQLIEAWNAAKEGKPQP